MTENEKEEIRRIQKRIWQEEEEEDAEIVTYYQRLGDMSEHCPGCDRDICGLIEEQQGMLAALCMSKREHLDKVAIHMSCHMSCTVL